MLRIIERRSYAEKAYQHGNLRNSLIEVGISLIHTEGAVYSQDSEQKASHAALTEYAISWIRKDCVQFTARDASDPSQIAGKRAVMVMLI